MTPDAGCFSPSYKHANLADPDALASLANILTCGEGPLGKAPGMAPTASPVKHTGDANVI